MKKRNQRILIVMLAAAAPMALADLFLRYLELPQPIIIVMMAILGRMLGKESRKWINKDEE